MAKGCKPMGHLHCAALKDPKAAVEIAGIMVDSTSLSCDLISLHSAQRVVQFEGVAPP